MKLKRFLAILGGLVLVAAPFLALSPVAVSTAAPTITVVPSEGTIGTPITIYATGSIGTEYAIYFSSQNATPNEDKIDLDVTVYKYMASGTAGGLTEGFSTMNLKVPDRLNDGSTSETIHGGTYYIYLAKASDGTIVAKTSFKVVDVAEASLEPVSGPVGTEVEIKGSGFAPGEQVRVSLNGDDLTDEIIEGSAEADNNGEIFFSLIIPEITYGEKAITIIGLESEAEVVLNFFVEPQVTLSSSSGPAGSRVTVSGTGFVKRNGVEIFIGTSTTPIDLVPQTLSDGSFAVEITIPASTAPGSHTITARDEDNAAITAQALFTVTPNPTLQITDADTIYHVGEVLIVRGENFTPGDVTPFIDAKELILDDVVTARPDGTFSASFTLPLLPRGTHTLIAQDSSGREASVTFSIEPQISLSPATGSPGTAVTIRGTGFDSGASILIRFDGDTLSTTPPTIISGSDGSFLGEFNVPQGVSAGEHTVSAIAGSGEAQATFSTLLEVVTGLTVPHPSNPVSFDWEDVSDSSGVTYDLQVALDPNFTNLVIDVSGLTVSTYTMPEEDRLEPLEDDAPYYWRVRAVDGAGNSSAWSAAGEFTIEAGFYWPEWTQWVWVGLGVVAAFVLGFWLGRRSMYAWT